MRILRLLIIVPAIVLSMTIVVGDLVHSGPKIGSYPVDFQVWDVTGPNAGRSLSYRNEYGAEPVICIFARKLDAPATKLVERVDAECSKNSVLKSFLVLLSGNDKENQELLRTAARTRGIKAVPLTISGKTEGPMGYQIDPDAEVTVVFWGGGQVRAVHALGAGHLSDEKIKGVIEDLPKIVR